MPSNEAPGQMPDLEGTRSRLVELAESLASFEATESRANTGTGSRREGEHFEGLVGGFWDSVALLAASTGASFSAFTSNRRKWRCVMHGPRKLILPRAQSDQGESSVPVPDHWMRLSYGVRELVSSYPGEGEAIARYAPRQHRYAGEAYPDMFSGLGTRFDGAVLLVGDGVLVEKVLLEYKTAKSSSGHQIDGNAHERLSFQIMQYLEVATRYPRCSLVVMANDAFVRYRNKYHVNFHVQADRLANFSWFRMYHFCTGFEHIAFADALLEWLFHGHSWGEGISR